MGSKALRLTFVYKDGVVQLASTTEVDMVVGRSDAVAGHAQQGFWAELRDAGNNQLFRRVVHNPMPVDLEVFSDQPDKNLARLPGAPTEGAFTVVVPNDPAAESVALFSSEHEVDTAPASVPQGLVAGRPIHALRAVVGRHGAAREVAHFKLKP